MWKSLPKARFLPSGSCRFVWTQNNPGNNQKLSTNGGDEDSATSRLCLRTGHHGSPRSASRTETRHLLRESLPSLSCPWRLASSSVMSHTREHTRTHTGTYAHSLTQSQSRVPCDCAPHPQPMCLFQHFPKSLTGQHQAKTLPPIDRKLIPPSQGSPFLWNCPALLAEPNRTSRTLPRPQCCLSTKSLRRDYRKNL